MAKSVGGCLFGLSLAAPALGSMPDAMTTISKKYWNPAAGSIANATMIKIGAPTTLDPEGRRYKLSTEMRRAYHMFLSDYVETYGGVLINGTRFGVDAYFFDDASQGSQAAWAAKELMDVVGLRLFLAGYSNDLTRAVASTVYPRGGVMVASGASFTDIYANRPTMFGTLPATAGYEASAIELMGMADGGVRKTMWFVAEQFDTRDLSPLAAQNNVDLLNVSRLPASGWAPVLEDAVRTIIRVDPDVVLLRTARDMCHAFVKRLWELNYSPKALILVTCPAGPAFIQSVGFAGQYVLHVTPWLPTFSLSGPLTGRWTASSFASKFESTFGVSPSYQVASAFIGVAALVHAIESANSTEPQAVADVLRTMNEGSIFGSLSFDANGQNNLRMKVTQYQFTESPKLLFPCTPAECEGTLVYPRPNKSLMDCMNPDPSHATRFGWLGGSCTTCPLGRTSAVVGSERRCVACVRGQAGRDTGDQLSCEDCRPGSYTDTEAAGSCLLCGLGSSANASGLAGCAACAVGRAADTPGMSECQACPEGTFQTREGQSSCQRCEEGRYGPAKGAVSCLDCPPSFSTQGTGFSEAASCGCPADTFDPSRWDAARPTRCEACPEGVACPGFSGALRLKPGFHEEGASFSPLTGVWRCADATACPGGAPGSCSGDRTGAACALCPEGRARGSDFRCPACHGGSALLPGLGIPAVLAALVLVYYVANGYVVQRTSVRLGLGLTVGMIITVVQILGIFNSLNIPWNRPVKAIFQASSYVSFESDSVSVECIVGGKPVHRYLLNFLAPFVIFAVFSLLAVASQALPRLTQGRLKAWTFTRSFNALFSLMQAVFIALMGMATVSVQCYSHPNGKMSMMKFPSIVCFEEEHNGIIAMGALLILLIVIPFLVTCAWGTYIVHRRTQMYGPRVEELQQYRFLIFRFQPMVWWWGNAFNARQLLLGLAPMIMPDDPAVQCYFIVLVFLLYLVALLYYAPWRVIELNVIDAMASSTMILAMVVGTSLLPPTATRGRHAVILTTLVIFVLSLLVAVLFYSTFLLAWRGRDKHYGMSFPPKKDMQRFTSEWIRLIRKLAKLTSNEHREVIHELDSYACLSLDRTMCIMESCFDVTRRHSAVNVSSSVEGSWVTWTKMLRLAASEHHLMGTNVASTSSCESGNIEPVSWVMTEISTGKAGQAEDGREECNDIGEANREASAARPSEGHPKQHDLAYVGQRSRIPTRVEV